MKTNLLWVFGVFMLISSAVLAQNDNKRFAVELKGGAAIPVKELNGSSLNAGFGFEGIVHYKLMTHTGLFAGWGWNKLPASHTFAGDDMCFEETGYVLGLQFMHPIADTRFSYYVHAAGLYKHIETENADGDIIHDSRHGMGYQLGGGVNFGLNGNWSLSAGLKFSSLTRETTFEGAEKNFAYSYISAPRIGLVKHF